MANDDVSRTAVARTLGVDVDAPPAPSRRWRGRPAWALVALAGVAGGVAWTRADSSPAVQYQTLPAERGDLRVTVTATGALEPTNQVDVGSEVSGTIVQVLVDEDDRVKAGQVLARIDPTRLEAQARQLQAALDAAGARLLQAQATREESAKQLRRLEQLYEATGGNLPSPQDFDTQRATARRAVADEASASASVSQAQASLQALRTDLGKAVIRSPIDGVVLTRSVEPGADGGRLVPVAGPVQARRGPRAHGARVDVDEADVGQVNEARTRRSPWTPTRAAPSRRRSSAALRVADDRRRRHVQGRAGRGQRRRSPCVRA